MQLSSRRRTASKFSAYLVPFCCSFLACMSSVSFATETAAPNKLGALLERRTAELKLARIAQSRKSVAPPEMYWREIQPIRVPMSEEDRQASIQEFEAALEEVPIDWIKIQKCLALFVYDSPNSRVEVLLLQTIERLPAFSIQCSTCMPQFEAILLNVGNQESAKMQELLVELIAPDFLGGFKVAAAKHWFDVIDPAERTLLSECVVGHMYGNADLDYAGATLTKALERLPKDSALALIVAKNLELLEKKMEGDPYPDGNTP